MNIPATYLAKTVHVHIAFGTVKDLVPSSALSFDHAGEHGSKGVLGRWYLFRS